MGLGRTVSKVECVAVVEKSYSIHEAKPNKHEPQSLKQLNQSANAKKDAAARFMQRYRQRPSTPQPTAEQTQRAIRNMFDSLDNRRGW